MVSKLLKPQDFEKVHVEDTQEFMLSDSGIAIHIAINVLIRFFSLMVKGAFDRFEVSLTTYSRV